jgi:hypothetical protein
MTAAAANGNDKTAPRLHCRASLHGNVRGGFSSGRIDIEKYFNLHETFEKGLE